MLAVQVSTIASNSYFGIGQILYERKLESKYGDAVVRRLSVDLNQRYPNMELPYLNLNSKRICSGDWLILQIVTTPSYSHEPLCDKKTEWLQLP